MIFADIERLVEPEVLVTVTELAVGRSAKLIPALEPMPPVTLNIGFTMQNWVVTQVAHELSEVRVKLQTQAEAEVAHEIPEIVPYVPPVLVTVPVVQLKFADAVIGSRPLVWAVLPT